MIFLVTVLVRLYRMVVSPALHTLVPVRAGCRFSPSCSENFEAAVRREGLLRGIGRGLAQLSRCHPLSSAPDSPSPVPFAPSS